MFKKNIYILFFIFFFSQLLAQEKEIKSDSTNVYQNIYDYSRKNETSKFLYRLFFRSSVLQSKQPKTQTKETRDYGEYQNKIIRHISINTLDPFGYSIDDTLRVADNPVEKFGNKIHIKSKKFTIKNLLLFKENNTYDSLQVSESERLIRSQRYTRKVKIITTPVGEANDSVDISIRVLDSWSLIPTGTLSSSKGTVKVTERNFFGLGHKVSGTYKHRFEDNAKTVSSRYTVSNIKNSYLTFELGYDRDFDNNSVRNISLNREFYSPLTKWAGGIYFENRLKTEHFDFVINDSVVKENTNFELYEFWLGRSFKLHNTVSRNTRIINAATYNFKTYSETPSLQSDPDYFFSNEKNFITHIGLTTQKYYQDKFLFNYDIIEDIPYGEIYALTFGYQERNNNNRLYFGSKIAYGKLFKFGYLSSSAEWGTFSGGNLPKQTSFKFEVNYFTKLLSLGNWKIRQFIKPSFVFGTNRFASEKDKITLRGDWGISGFNSPITGTQKWVLNFQTQTYAPKAWYGFRFSPYLNVTLGSIAERNDNLLRSKVYPKFSVGVLLNNDFLVFNSFQISFSYFPTIPFSGDNVFKTNSFENDDLTISDFQLSKPAYIAFD